MPASKAQQKAVSKYMKENYDVYQIRMPKGKKETIQNAAASQGQSVNAYINQAIDERMNRDAPQSVSNASESDSGDGSICVPSDVETPPEGAENAVQGE